MNFDTPEKENPAESLRVFCDRFLDQIEVTSWEEIFSDWEENECHQSGWQEHWKRRGFQSWQEWRTSYLKNLAIEKGTWFIGILKNPTQDVKEFYGSPNYGWQEKVYGKDNKTLTFEDIVKSDFVTEHQKITEIRNDFPDNTLLIAVEFQGEIIIIEGMHRTCALATWTKDTPFSKQVRLAITKLTLEELPNIGHKPLKENPS